MSLESGSPAQKGSPRAERLAPELHDEGEDYSEGEVVHLARKIRGKNNTAVQIGPTTCIYVRSTEHAPEMLIESRLCESKLEKALVVQAALSQHQLPNHEKEVTIPLSELNTHVLVHYRSVERLHVVRRYTPSN